MKLKINDYSTLTFDCYGTLIDWETGIHDALRLALSPLVEAKSKNETLEQYAKVEARIERRQPNLPYTRLLQEVHRQIAIDEGIAASESDHARFSESIAQWPAFADSAESLKYLKQHYKLVVLSNVDNIGFAKSSLHLEVDFDAVYTAEDIGSYKPSIRNFEYMLENLAKMGIARSEVLHTAQSLYHDMVPAATMGLARCWIDRRSGQEGSGATPVVAEPVEVDFRFESLAEMVAAHKAATVG